MSEVNAGEPKRLCNCQELEAVVSGPDDANRLFVYTGMAEVEIVGAEPHPRWSQEIITFTVGREFSGGNDKVMKSVVTASLSAIRNEGVASFAGWRIYAAATDYDDQEKKVRVNILIGARDTEGVLEQVAWQVNVLAHVE